MSKKVWPILGIGIIVVLATSMLVVFIGMGKVPETIVTEYDNIGSVSLGRSINDITEDSTSIIAGIIPYDLVQEDIMRDTLQLIATENPETILLVSSDRVGVSQYPLSTMSHDISNGVKIDSALRDALEIDIDNEAFINTPSMMERLDIVNKHFPEAAVLPIIISEDTSADTLDVFTNALIKNAPPNTVVLASVDYSRDLPSNLANVHNAYTQSLLQTFDIEELYTADVDCWQCLYVISTYAKNYEADYVEHEQVNSVTYDTAVAIEDDVAITMLAVGDIMVGRFVETLMRSNGDGYPFEKVQTAMQGVNIILGNLEGPIPVSHSQTPNEVLLFSFRESTARLLAEQKFTDVSLANNHTLDRGEDDYFNTITELEEVGISTIGHPWEVDFERVVSKTINDKKIIFTGFHDATRRVDAAAAVELIAQLRSENPDAFIVTTIHCGSEYVLHSNSHQQNLAHQLVDAGTDVIIGHHPHVVQEVELYNGKVIFYSLGNYVFDQYFSQNTQEGLMVGIELTDKEVRYSLHPLVSKRSQVQLMPEIQVQPWLEELALRSSDELEGIKDGLITIDNLLTP